MKEIEPLVPEEHDIEYREKKLALSRIFGLQGSEAKIENLGVSIELSATSVRLSIQTLKEIKPVVCEKIKFEYPQKVKNHSIFFLEFSDYQDCDAKHKITDSSTHSCTS